MSTLYISEYVRPAFAAGTAMPIAQEPALVEQAVAIDVTANESYPFSPSATFICVHADDNCCLAFRGAAVAGVKRMAANETRYFGVAGGMTLSVIASD
jgi:hypothetical protein